MFKTRDKIVEYLSQVLVCNPNNLALKPCFVFAPQFVGSNTLFVTFARDCLQGEVWRF